MNANPSQAMEKRILYIFTRTPLHVGAGASVGAIDLPIIRERHTGFPVIPATSLKGTFADTWNDELKNGGYKRVRKKGEREWEDTEAAWLFGSDDANRPYAGALQFAEARLLAFPVRSAKGSFAWITCPLILRRAKRDGVRLNLGDLIEPSDTEALFPDKSPVAIDNKVILEEYTFTGKNGFPESLAEGVKALLKEDPVFAEVASRLIILSDGMMSFFAQNACEVAQHVRIDDETGTAASGALFNQENVPSETLFYAVLHATHGRGPSHKKKAARDALEAFEKKVSGRPFQFGADASTGLGWCTVTIANPAA